MQNHPTENNLEIPNKESDAILEQTGVVDSEEDRGAVQRVLAPLKGTESKGDVQAHLQHLEQAFIASARQNDPLVSLDQQIHEFIRFLTRFNLEKIEGAQRIYSIDELNTASIDQWPEAGQPDFFTHVLKEAGAEKPRWAEGMDGEKLLRFQQNALLHLARRLRKTGDVDGALVANGRRKSILEHTPNAEKDAAMVAWEMAILRRDNQKDFAGAREDFDEAVRLAKKGKDGVGAVYNEFNLRQMENVEVKAAKEEGKPVDRELILAAFDAIESLKDMIIKVGTGEPRRVSALMPNMITELVEAQILLEDRERATEFVAELKQQERVVKSLAESGETIWKKIVADLERGINRIAQSA